MNQELTTQELQEMGLGKSFQTYRILTVDNGDDKEGTNATGDWVIKTKNDAGDFERENFGKEIKGVVLMSRAKLSSKFSKNANSIGWYSNEFVPGLESEVVIKQMGSDKKELARGTYNQIKQKFTVDDGMGNITKNYVYRTYIYLKQGDEIIKLQLGGRSQGKWFEYELDALKKETICEIKKDDDGYFATFRDGDDVDFAENCNAMRALKNNVAPALAAPQQEQIEAPKQPVEEEIPTINVDDDIEEVKIEDVPF